MALIGLDRMPAAVEALELLGDCLSVGLGHEHQSFIRSSELLHARCRYRVEGSALADPVRDRLALLEGQFELLPLVPAETIGLPGQDKLKFIQ